MFADALTLSWLGKAGQFSCAGKQLKQNRLLD